MNIPETKISETLLEFGEPLLGLLDDPTPEEFRAMLNIVIAVWNAHGVSTAKQDGRGVYLEELARFRQQMADEGAPAVLLNGLDALSRRRETDYADDPRCVGEWDLISDGEGGYRLRCEARLPG